MQKFKRLILMRDVGMLKKLIISFLILFIIPVSIIGIITYKNYSYSIEKSATTYVSQLIVEVINKLDTTFSDLRGATIIPLYLPDMQDLLENNESYTKKNDDLKPYLNTINRNNKGQYTTYFFDNSGNVFTDNYAFGVYSRKDTESFYSQIKGITEKANGEFVLLGPNKITDAAGNSKYVLTVARSIKNIKVPTYKSVGIIAIDIDLNIFDNTIQKIDRITKGKTLIVDKNNKIIYDSDFTRINKTYDDNIILSMANEQTGSFSLQIQGEKSIFIYAIMPNTEWKMFVQIPANDLFKDAVSNSKMVLIVSLVTGVIALLIYTMLAFTLTRPLRKLAELMKLVRKGDMDVHFDVKYNDEVGLVASNFNNMMKRIKELIEEVYLTKLRKQQAEIDVLQGQINPHFIYNTLETIRMLSVLNGVSELADISSTFGTMLRYSVNRGQEIVTIQDEMEHLEMYIYIQNKRFSNKFKLYNHISEHHKGIKTIKLIFQPIVENAILHGLEKKKGTGNIVITSEEVPEFLLFRIKDDGTGIDPESLFQINRELETGNVFSENRKHIGVKNVNERIKLFYGEKYGLSLESIKDSGTEVIFKLPLIEREGTSVV